MAAVDPANNEMADVKPANEMMEFIAAVNSAKEIAAAAAVKSAKEIAAAVKPTEEYNKAWNNAHKDTPAMYKKYIKRGLEPSLHELRTHTYYNPTTKQKVFGVSGNLNNINKIKKTLTILKRCPKVMKINSINVNNTGQYTLFTEFKFYGDTLQFIDKLIKLLGKDKITTNDTLMEHILLEFAKAIQCIHLNNITHLDIKPENFVFDENMNGSLIDFENDQIGYICLYNKDTITTKSYTLPYILYMKAKQMDNFYFNGFEQDIYSFTCILFILIQYISKSPISKYRKIINTLVKHMDITPKQFLQYQVLFLYDDTPNLDEYIKAIYENRQFVYHTDTFKKYWENYNSPININETDFDKKILELLLPSLEYVTSSKVSKTSYYNTIATLPLTVIAETPFAMPRNNPFGPTKKKIGGRHTRIYQKRKTQKRRHQRKASRHTKKQ